MPKRHSNKRRLRSAIEKISEQIDIEKTRNRQKLAMLRRQKKQIQKELDGLHEFQEIFDTSLHEMFSGKMQRVYQRFVKSGIRTVGDLVSDVRPIIFCPNVLNGLQFMTIRRLERVLFDWFDQQSQINIAYPTVRLRRSIRGYCEDDHGLRKESEVRVAVKHEESLFVLSNLGELVELIPSEFYESDEDKRKVM